jgi:hypothetical protein
LRAEAEEAAGTQLVAAAREAGRKPIGVAKRSTPEEVAAFRARARGTSEEIAEAVDEAMMHVGADERYLAGLMLKLFEEAQWMGITGQFGNGLPLIAQNRYRVGVLAKFLGAINRRQSGGGSSTEPPGEGGVETDGTTH